MSRFTRNMGFYFVGTFATKLLQLIFIPIYTKFLSTETIGDYSVIMVSVSLAIPLLFQSIWEGSFRFSIEAQDDGRMVLATSSKYCFVLMACYSIIFIVVSWVIDLKFAIYILLFGIGQILVQYWQFASRALKENKLYSIASVVNSAITIALNIILIVFFNQGLKSLLIANTVGAFVMVFILEYKIRIIRDINKYPYNKILLKNIIKYSIPLAINTISWWLFTSSNSYIITGIMGASQTGIYSMAMKFGSILATLTTVITLAWNEEAFRTFGNKNQHIQFNTILLTMTKALLCVVLILIPITFLAYKYLVFGTFKIGVALTPIIYLGAVYNTIACHLGSIFLARKESNKLFYTTLAGGIVAVVFSLVLVHQIGILGAVIASLIGYMVNFFIRIPSIKKRILLEIPYGWLIGLTFLVFLMGYCCDCFKDSTIILFAVSFIAIVIFILVNKSIIRGILVKLKNH